MRSVVDRNVVLRRILALNCTSVRCQLSNYYMWPVPRDATGLMELMGARENPAVQTKVRSANFDCGES